MEPTDRRSDILIQLSEGNSSLTTSDQWLRHLNCQSRFHRYSFGNVVLIAAQLPQANQVAGFHAWKKLGRSVRKGEKAIWILAPMVARRAMADGPEDEQEIRGFKYVPVFDISQTEGDDLPAVCHKLSGHGPSDCFARLIAVARSIGYSVECAALQEGLNGDCAFSLRRIRVETRNSPAQQVKTLAHDPLTAPMVEGGSACGRGGDSVSRSRKLACPVFWCGQGQPRIDQRPLPNAYGQQAPFSIGHCLARREPVFGVSPAPAESRWYQ